MDRSIIHLNVADFAVAVERITDGRLKYRPVIIAPEGAARPLVYDMSEEAYRSGVRKGMALHRAARLCRDARILSPHPDRYERAMGALFKQALRYSPLVEPGHRDGHLFIDMTGAGRLFGPCVDVAWRLNKQAKEDFGLDPIWAVATSKLVAKVASRLVKPSGEYIVGAGEEAVFLAPLPLHLIPGIERNELVRLREFNLTRVSHVARLRLVDLETPFGFRARFIHDAVRGIDPAPVLPVGRRHLTVKVSHAFDDDTNDIHQIAQGLRSMVEEAGTELRRLRRAACGLKIILDYSDGIRSVRQRAVTPPAIDDRTLFESAACILKITHTRRVRVRHMGLICIRTASPAGQRPLFAEDRRDQEKRIHLAAAVDGIRGRFGKDAVFRATARGATRRNLKIP